MYHSIAYVLYALGLCASLVSAVVVVAVGYAYHPDAGLPMPLLLAGIALLLTLLPVLLRIRSGPLRIFPSTLALGLGLILGGLGLVGMLREPGDLVFYAGPVAVGLALALLAFEEQEGTV